MKKLLFLGICCLMGTSIACAETVYGKVIRANDDTLTVKTEDGQKMDMQMTDNTTYRQKRVRQRIKKSRHQMSKMDGYFEPMVEEDDWVEITYTPNNNVQEIQEVIIYDD